MLNSLEYVPDMIAFASAVDSRRCLSVIIAIMFNTLLIDRPCRSLDSNQERLASFIDSLSVNETNLLSIKVLLLSIVDMADKSNTSSSDDPVAEW